MTDSSVYIDVDGTVSAPLAGIHRSGIEYSNGYDPEVAHDAAELEIPDNVSPAAVQGAYSLLTLDANDDLYFSGNVLNRYVLKIH